jgi:hypothetical protein
MEKAITAKYVPLDYFHVVDIHIWMEVPQYFLWAQRETISTHAFFLLSESDRALVSDG